MLKKRRSMKKYNKLKFKPDSFYQSYWLAKFINKFMRDGKKHVIENALWKTFCQTKIRTKKMPLTIFFAILMKIRPLFGFISKQFRKQRKKIPVPLYPRRQIIIALKWLVLSIKVKNLHSLEKRILSEFFDFLEKRKTALFKRCADHIADLNENRINMRYRWK